MSARGTRPYVTFADYLEAERNSDIKHEWIDGAVYAMHQDEAIYAGSRGTPEHARLSARITSMMCSALANDCDVYSSDLLLYVAEVNVSTYADCSVVRGSLETFAAKKHGTAIVEAVTNPVVIIEVLAASTERYDREEKFAYYRHLASLQEYVVVSQDELLIEVFRRPADGGCWKPEIGRAGDVVTIQGRTIEVDDVYGTPRRTRG